jgi:hypothetical protein
MTLWRREGRAAQLKARQVKQATVGGAILVRASRGVESREMVEGNIAHDRICWNLDFTLQLLVVGLSRRAASAALHVLEGTSPTYDHHNHSSEAQPGMHNFAPSDPSGVEQTLTRKGLGSGLTRQSGGVRCSKFVTHRSRTTQAPLPQREVALGNWEPALIERLTSPNFRHMHAALCHPAEGINQRLRRLTQVLSTPALPNISHGASFMFYVDQGTRNSTRYWVYSFAQYSMPDAVTNACCTHAQPRNVDAVSI